MVESEIMKQCLIARATIKDEKLGWCVRHTDHRWGSSLLEKSTSHVLMKTLIFW